MKTGLIPGEKWSRREFVIGATFGAAIASLPGLAATVDRPTLPIVVFSKVYQELKLGFEQAAALTSEAGLDGVDCPVRPKGETLPERVVDELPQYATALGKHHLQMPLITSAITEVKSPHAEDILRTAKKLGVQFYRLGFFERRDKASVPEQITEIKARLKELAALNRQIGIGALFQNHSPTGRTFVGGDLNEMQEIVSGFDPAQVGVAFDIGHALVVHGSDWRRHFDRLKTHIRIAYIKDVQPKTRRWVPFGQGEIGKVGYFELLRQIGYHAPVSLHIEFDWHDQGRNRTCARLLEVLRHSRGALTRWLAGA